MGLWSRARRSVARAGLVASALGLSPSPATAGPSVQLALHDAIDDPVTTRAVGSGARTWSPSAALSLVAAPGERETAGFIVQGQRAARVAVQLGTLRHSSGDELPAAALTLRSVQRTPMRRQFNRDGTEVVGRFAPTFEPRALGPEGFAELWLEVQPPLGTRAGLYKGDIEVRVGASVTTRSVRVRVRPLRLAPTTAKTLGMFYRISGPLADPVRVQRELADMRAHGIEDLVLDVRPVFGWGPGHVFAVDTAAVRAALRLVQDAGFTGTVVVDSGFVPMARVLGHDDVAYADAAGASLDGPTASVFEDACRSTMGALEDVRAQGFPFELAVMHIDEVFERGRLPLFERLAARGKAVSDLPVYATFSTAAPAHDALRARIDPLVDLRGHHGYSFEWWLLRGGSAEDYLDELRESDDEAWYYHNERGTYFTGRWARLVNGLYLWASPFSGHTTWAYQAFDGKPLDDADGTSHDFGMSFPDPRDAQVLMPTRIWTALGEGHDDLRYLATLERAVRRHRAAAPDLADDAQRFLNELRTDILRTPPGVDVSKLGRRVGTPDEAPMLEALAARYDGAALARVRTRVEELTVALEVAGQQ